jgi:hypothetical protein
MCKIRELIKWLLNNMNIFNIMYVRLKFINIIWKLMLFYYAKSSFALNFTFYCDYYNYKAIYSYWPTFIKNN